MKYSVITFGCRVNQADSLGFEEELLASGARPSSPDEADLVLVNTCSVTASADQGARQTIRRVARQNPGARIIVTGCYATRKATEVGQLPNVDRVVSNVDKPRLISILREADIVAAATTTSERFGEGDGACGARIEPGVAGRTAFTLRVQTGCAELCSYCIIPTTRGTPKSVPLDMVESEVARVASAGYKEIALTGVHLGSYGRDLTPESSLISLLRRLDEVCGRTEPSHRGAAHPVFRISSLEPNDCTPDIVELIAGSGCFAPHFHLPLQHASDRILHAMRRPYALVDYARLVDDIRRRLPSASIGSDIIVGFPGETDDDFEQLASYLEISPLTHVHVFPYSDRPGTAASILNNKVPGPVVRERGRRIRELSARKARRFVDAQAGSVHRALTIEDGSLAVTGNYLKVRIPPGCSRNEWIDVTITNTDPLIGVFTYSSTV